MSRMNELIERLHKASVAYYKYDNPIMSDKEYDKLYDELEELEKSSGIVLAGSPTHKVQGYLLDGFKKVEHSKPMLSAAKTKDINEIVKFVGNNEWYVSGKLDGLTLVTIYENGEFVQGITRGNGVVGEDVTEACRFIKNLPMQIPYKDYLELRGECVMSYKEFSRINENLIDKYSHPRNLAAGTLRQLDLNVIKERKLSYVVFECVTDLGDDKYDVLKTLDEFGFETVSRMKPEFISSENCVQQIADAMQIRINTDGDYPYDGLVFELNSRKLSKSLGKTEHHENCRMALKWTDTTCETTLLNIEWSVGKTGIITPIAIFDTVEIDNVKINRASLSNISIMRKTLGKPFVGEKIWVSRMNMVIPKITKSIDMEGNIHEI